MNEVTKYHFAGIIPARYASSRFPGKPLALIGDKPMIQRVYEQAARSLDLVCVATDDSRIFKTVTGFGGKAVMTSPDHMSGTDRCAEAVTILQKGISRTIDIVVNIQGDEPFIKPEQIDLLTGSFNDRAVKIVTLIRKVEPGENLFNPNQVKVIISKNGDAIYFSRAAIPYLRDSEMDTWTHHHCYFKHLGLYAYRSNTLKKICSLPRSPLEISESLEQNRWIENGFKIRTAVTQWESISIDTPEDLERTKSLINDFI